MEDKKDSVVRVLRYFRKNVYDKQTGEKYIHNLGGMTAVCDLDYDKNTITAYGAFCRDDDNFDRNTGILYAQVSESEGIGFVVALDKALSIEQNIVRSVKAGSVAFLNDKSERRIKKHLEHHFLGVK